ncbi:MAG: formylglycine-generating enzyme family protein [Planctomycetota bacterium]
MRVAPALLALLALLAAGAAGCDGNGGEEPLLRRGPHGSLRDLVLFDRGAAGGGPLFLDRFEVTRGDWAEFATTAAGRAAGAAPLPALRGDEAVLPMAFVDLTQARAFARWRRCRLPRSDEWTFACTTDGKDTYPWGSLPDAARANTSDLGVFAPLPVGTFESGRNGDGPYDLIGNVSEWTETVPASWFHARREALPPVRVALGRLRRAVALTLWSPLPELPPLAFAIAAAGDLAPREVLGADFATSMREGPQLRAPGERSSALGLRLCTTPQELLTALAGDLAALDGEGLQQLRAFARRPGHAAALRQALPAAQLSPAARARFEALLP